MAADLPTIRLPGDEHKRLQAPAKANAFSLDRLMDELATVALADHDARECFKVRAARSQTERALALLDKVERAV